MSKPRHHAARLRDRDAELRVFVRRFSDENSIDPRQPT